MAGEWRERPLAELTDNFDGTRVPVKEADRRPGPYPYYGAFAFAGFRRPRRSAGTRHRRDSCRRGPQRRKLAYGKALKAEDRRDGNIPVYGSNGQVGWHDERLVPGPGIVVGRKGNPGIATWVPTDFFPSTPRSTSCRSRIAEAWSSYFMPSGLMTSLRLGQTRQCPG